MNSTDLLHSAYGWRALLGQEPADLLLEQDQRYLLSLDNLAMAIEPVRFRRLLVVLDRAALEASGLASVFWSHLSSLDNVALFEAFSPNPRSEDAANAARAAASIHADAVLALGGGSCHDVAKIAALAARTPKRIEELSRGEELDHADPLPLIAVPTTSGTGSDATHFAAIYVQGRKVSVAHPSLRPSIVVLDVRFHRSMPATLAACTGCDALGQAMESLWSVGATPRSIAFARAAGPIIGRHLLPSVLHARPLDRLAMMVAAHLAGEAINISTTTASHAMSYELTQRFGLMHGHAVALTLGHLGRANAQVVEADCQDVRGPTEVRGRVREAAAFLNTTPDELPHTVRRLLDAMGLDMDLRAVGVRHEDCRELAAAVDPQRLGNNPRRLNTRQLTRLLLDAMGDHTDPAVGLNETVVRVNEPNPLQSGAH